MYYQIQIRRGTAAEWTATNPILAAGELAVESDTNKMKVGNGSTAWNSLSYATSTPTQLNLKADLASPTFTGNVVLPSTTSIGTVSATEIGYVDGVTSAIQTQLDSKLTATTAVTSNRNKIINGAMQIAQRGTSTASITTSGYYTSDRWRHTVNSHGTWTSTVEADAPSGSGFTNSLKMLCTTAAASPSAGSHVRVGQYTEGFPLQSLAFGSAGAKQITVSFWVKSNVTGTYVLMLYNADPSPNRHCSQSYTINASGTWEKKIITFPADTVGVFHNNNGFSLACDFFIGAGTDRTSGTLQTSWATSVTANEAVGQVNVAAATNNYFQITGIQLEEGSVATPFEFEDFGDTLRKCMRYYQKSFRQDIAPATATNNFDGALQWQGNGGGFGAWCHRSLPVIMRSAPLVTLFNPVSANSQARNTAAGVDIQSCTATGYTSAITTVASGTNDAASQGSAIHYTLSSEL